MRMRRIWELKYQTHNYNMGRSKGLKNKQLGNDQPAKDLIKISLKCVGRTFQSEGSTFEEAIHKIKISGGARAKSVITIEKDGQKREKILNARLTNGLFGQGSPTLKMIHLKGIKQILGV